MERAKSNRPNSREYPTWILGKLFAVLRRVSCKGYRLLEETGATSVEAKLVGLSVGSRIDCLHPEASFRIIFV